VEELLMTWVVGWVSESDMQGLRLAAVLRLAGVLFLCPAVGAAAFQVS
jgi:hypothetical protein